MIVYKLYLDSIFEAKPPVLLGKSRTQKGINRIVYRMKKKLGYESIPYCRYWGTKEYEHIDFGCHSHIFLVKKEVI